LAGGGTEVGGAATLVAALAVGPSRAWRTSRGAVEDSFAHLDQRQVGDNHPGERREERGRQRLEAEDVG
jgi:hypothetical protein